MHNDGTLQTVASQQMLIGGAQAAAANDCTEPVLLFEPEFPVEPQAITSPAVETTTSYTLNEVGKDASCTKFASNLYTPFVEPT